MSHYFAPGNHASADSESRQEKPGELYLRLDNPSSCVVLGSEKLTFRSHFQ